MGEEIPRKSLRLIENPLSLMSVHPSSGRVWSSRSQCNASATCCRGGLDAEGAATFVVPVLPAGEVAPTALCVVFVACSTGFDQKLAKGLENLRADNHEEVAAELDALRPGGSGVEGFEDWH